MNKIYSLATTFFLSLSLNSFAVTQGGGSKATAPQEVSGATRLKILIAGYRADGFGDYSKRVKVLRILEKAGHKAKIISTFKPNPPAENDRIAQIMYETYLESFNKELGLYTKTFKVPKEKSY